MVYSVEEAMNLLGCRRRRIFQLLREGKLERAPRYGRSLRIYRDSVEAALARPKAEEKRARKRMGRAPIVDPSEVRI